MFPNDLVLYEKKCYEATIVMIFGWRIEFYIKCLVEAIERLRLLQPNEGENKKRKNTKKHFLHHVVLLIHMVMEIIVANLH